MNTITVEVPEDKEAVWKDNVLTLVDKEATRTGYSRCRCAKFIKGDKVYCRRISETEVFTVSGWRLVGDRFAYTFEGYDEIFTFLEDWLEPCSDITERIKTFEDACKWCKKNDRYYLVEQYQDALNAGL